MKTNQVNQQQIIKPVLKLEILKHKESIICASLTGTVCTEDANDNPVFIPIGVSGDGDKGLQLCETEINKCRKKAFEFQLVKIESKV